MPLPPALVIDPPLVNSANPWATDLADLTALYNCEHTGAVTTRTSLIHGFDHDDAVHRHVFFDPVTHHQAGSASVNSLGYSPLNLASYLGFIKHLALTAAVPASATKGFIVSVTGSPQEVVECYRQIASTQESLAIPLAMEINLSCPNIPKKPPPAYDGAALLSYLEPLRDEVAGGHRIPFGLKTPPYTHSAEYRVLIEALLACGSGGDGVCPVSFITATNTLGSCLVLSEADPPVPLLPGAGLGGMAGAPLHPLALGNVATIRRLLDEHAEKLGHVRIIGVGGVVDRAGYLRMKSVGAYAVGVGTGLGLRGVDVFADIAMDTAADLEC